MPNFRNLLVSTLASCALFACSQSSTHTEESEPATLDITQDASLTHTANIINTQRETIGSVTLASTQHGISARVRVAGLTPGEHGMHFHKVGDCSDAQFKKSGGHINPDAKQHGLSNTHGPDNADLPNLIVDSNGIGDQIVTNNRLTLYKDGPLPELFDADGSALVIHANADDQISQPIGGAGARVACAVIQTIR